MAKLRWSPQAADDLVEACEFIARDSEQYARLFAQQVMATLKGMAKQKLPGSMVPEYENPDIRERYTAIALSFECERANVPSK